MTAHTHTNSAHLLGALRIPFLLLTPVCVALGVGLAFSSGSNINVLHVSLVLIGALCAHISVNTFNEYFDFKSGLDLLTQRTPFSGGSGTLPLNPEFAPTVLLIAWLSFIATALIGGYFVITIGWGLLPLGFAGLVIVLFYTTFITRRPALCLLAPGLGFGPIMVMGTSFVLTGAYSWMAFFVSLVPFFLVNNLLLLNQFPDIEADRQIGRKHFPITLGKRNSSLIFVTFSVLAFGVIVGGVLANIFPPGSLWGLLALLIALPTMVSVVRHAENSEKLLPWMKFNVLINLLTPSLMSAGMILGAVRSSM